MPEGSDDLFKRIAFKVLLVQPPVPWFKTIQGCAADCAPGSGASSSLARRRPAVPRLRRSAPLLALFGLLAAIGTRRSRVRKSIARQVGISRCRFDIGVPEQLANHRQGLAERPRAGSEAVSEISFADARSARCRGTSACGRALRPSHDGFVPGLPRFIVPLVEELAPSLLELEGVGTENAGAVMVAVGDNPDRLRSEASFAMMCGVCPIPASSGKTQRHRLNRGGNRQANFALHMVVVCRMRTDERTRWTRSCASATPP